MTTETDIKCPRCSRRKLRNVFTLRAASIEVSGSDNEPLKTVTQSVDHEQKLRCPGCGHEVTESRTVTT